MTEMTEFQQRASAIAVKKMLQGRYFSVCDLDAIAKTMGRESELAGRDYAALRAVHCVEWADMGPDLARMTREKCLELLGLSGLTISITPDREAEKPPAPAKHLRLAFWRGA